MHVTGAVDGLSSCFSCRRVRNKSEDDRELEVGGERRQDIGILEKGADEGRSRAEKPWGWRAHLQRF